jgi:hypothetical protein
VALIRAKGGREPVTTYLNQPDQDEEPAWWELDVRLGDASPDLLAAVWKGEFNPSRSVWCAACSRVWPAARIWLTDGDCWCPDCSAAAASLHWWDGWPRVALPGWVAAPVEGTYYFLPDCVYNSIERDAAGALLLPYMYSKDPLRFLTAPPEGHTH